MFRPMAMFVLAAVAATGTATADDAGAKLYKSKCSSCHGKTGDGKTTAGKKLGVKDWTDGKVLRELTDAEIRKIVVGGVKGPDQKWRMAPFPKLGDVELAAMIEYMRELARR